MDRKEWTYTLKCAYIHAFSKKLKGLIIVNRVSSLFRSMRACVCMLGYMGTSLETAKRNVVHHDQLWSCGLHSLPAPLALVFLLSLHSMSIFFVWCWVHICLFAHIFSVRGNGNNQKCALRLLDHATILALSSPMNFEHRVFITK
jgi:hypothetical protein